MGLFPDDDSASMKELRNDNGDVASETSFEVDTDFDDVDTAPLSVLADTTLAPAAKDEPAYEGSTVCRLCVCHGGYTVQIIEAAENVPFFLGAERGQGSIIGNIQPSMTPPGPEYETTDIYLCTVRS
jgi:hypothetical protein